MNILKKINRYDILKRMKTLNKNMENYFAHNEYRKYQFFFPAASDVVGKRNWFPALIMLRLRSP